MKKEKGTRFVRPDNLSCTQPKTMTVQWIKLLWTFAPSKIKLFSCNDTVHNYSTQTMESAEVIERQEGRTVVDPFQVNVV